MLAFSLDAAMRADSVERLVIVAGTHTVAAVKMLVARAKPHRKPVSIVTGGVERQHSVALGLAATAPDADVVVIHDAARPLVESVLFDRCVAAARSTGGAIAATPVADTIKRVRDGRIVATVPRDDLWAAQTPQAFQRARLVAAFASELAGARAFTDEAGLFEALGWEVEIVPGNPTNMKITVPADLAVAEALLACRQETIESAGRSEPADPSPPGSTR